MSLTHLLPKHKHDLAAAESLVALGWRAVEPVAEEVLTWLQDINWPVARVFAPFLAQVGADLAPYVSPILRSDDDIWKYYLIQAVVARSAPLARAVEVELRRMSQQPTASEHKEEVDQVASEALEQL